MKARSIKTIFLKQTGKGNGVNITLDINELKKVPDWVKEKKEGQELRQFFVGFSIDEDGLITKPSLYEMWDDNDPNYPKDEKEEQEKTPF